MLRVCYLKVFLTNTFASTKGQNRGYGLSNVKEMIDELQGWIDIHPEEEGTTLSVYLLKQK